jgi:hypothetical protein
MSYSKITSIGCLASSEHLCGSRASSLRLSKERRLTIDGSSSKSADPDNSEVGGYQIFVSLANFLEYFRMILCQSRKIETGSECHNEPQATYIGGIVCAEPIEDSMNGSEERLNSIQSVKSARRTRTMVSRRTKSSSDVTAPPDCVSALNWESHSQGRR